MYRSVPNIVTDYCDRKQVDISETIEKEAERKKPGYWMKF